MVVRCVIIFILFAFIGCVSDAPHENTYDPLSPAYKGTGTIEGIIAVKDRPGSTLSDVWVQVLPQKIATKSDEHGYYRIDNVKKGYVTMYFSREYYTPETLNVYLEIGEIKNINVSMNGFPVISSAAILSRRIDGTPPEYFVDVRANISDPNGLADIDSVWFIVEDDEFLMDYNVANKFFEVRIHASVLPIEYLIGKQLYIKATDRTKAIRLSYPFALAQPIDQVAQPLYPFIGDTVTSPIEFSWAAPVISFNYSYSITFARLQGSGASQMIVWKTVIEPLRAELTRYQYTVMLPSGKYSWAIAIVDINGNWSQSREITFFVR